MIYDVEKVVDYMGEEPEWKYRIVLSAVQLEELAQMAESAVKEADSRKDIAPMLRFYDIGRAFRGMVRNLGRRDLDSIENFKINRPLPVPAMRRNMDCE